MPAFVKGPSGHPTHSQAQSESPSPRPAAGASAHRTAPASFAPDRHHPRHGGLRSQRQPLSPLLGFLPRHISSSSLCRWLGCCVLTAQGLGCPPGLCSRTPLGAGPEPFSQLLQYRFVFWLPGARKPSLPSPRTSLRRGAGKLSPPGHSLRDLCASNNSDTLCPHQSQPQKTLS